MRRKIAVISLSVGCLFLLSLAGACGGASDSARQHGEHAAESSEHFERGPHGGRLLSDGDFAVELQIFERGVPPQYRVYAFQDGKPVAPGEVSANVQVRRLANPSEQFQFQPVGDFLVSDKEVREPHSFDVEVHAEYQGRQHVWTFSSYEGRTMIPDTVATHSGVIVDKVGARDMKTRLRARGKIVPSEHNIAHVIPRFSGVVREGRKHIGDPVQKGEVLAIIESNQSLQPFEVRSPIAGQVINGHLILGEFVPENQWVYIVADLSEVWADLFVPLSARQAIREGQKVAVSSADGSSIMEGQVSYIAPYADEKSQSRLVRVVIPNKAQAFLPGMFVTGDIVTQEYAAPTVVKQSALQTFRDWQVVFIKEGETYEIRPVTLGKTDGEWVEVMDGLKVGQDYVAENAFLIKADILKSGASHDH